MPEALGALQIRFAEGLLDGRCEPVELFRGPGELAARRLALYRGNLAANWERALANAYPVLKALVGDQFFHALARRFGRAQAFGEGDLNRLGAGLATFLEQFEAVRDFPYFPDMARLEWALHCAHYAADAPALEMESLARLDPAAIDELRLEFRPGTDLIASPWAIGMIWSAHQADSGQALPADPAQPSRNLVYRPQWRAQTRSLAAGEFAALSALSSGQSLGAALEAALDAQADFDPAGAFPLWIADRLFLPLSQDLKEN